MTALPGTWALTMRTPIGSIHADMTFTGDDTNLSGTAVGSAETVDLRDVVTTPASDGERVTWSQSITKPLRLNLDFDVTVSRDEMHGFSRAGRLPRSAVTGRRIGG